MNVFIFCMCLAALVAPLHGSAPHYREQVLQAHELYRQGKYEDAYQLYDQIPHKSSQLYYNLGNCSYKMGKKGKALALWRRAEWEWGIFNREELIQNIELVKKELQVKPGAQEQEKKPLIALTQAARKIRDRFLSFVRSFPLVLMQILFLVFWFVLFMYIRFLYRRKYRALVAVFGFFTIFFGTMLAVKYNMMLRDYVVLVQNEVKVLSGPGNDFHILGVAREGSEGIIKKESGEFYKVKINGQFGWISKSSCEKV